MSRRAQRDPRRPVRAPDIVHHRRHNAITRLAGSPLGPPAQACCTGVTADRIPLAPCPERLPSPDAGAAILAAARARRLRLCLDRLGRGTGPAKIRRSQREMARFARCMGAHGERLPNPTTSPRVFKNAFPAHPTPAFQSAFTVCGGHLQPGGGPPNHAAAADPGHVAAVRTTRKTGGRDPAYTPRQLETAYAILPLLNHGTNGHGETVVLPELAEPQFPLPTSDIRRDLAAFESLFRLPPARIRVVRNLARSASPWRANGEEELHPEVVHAIAPDASIIELLIKGNSLNSAASAVPASVAALRLGSSLGSVISISAAGQTRRRALRYTRRAGRPTRGAADSRRPPRHRCHRVRRYRRGRRTLPGDKGVDRRRVCAGEGSQPARRRSARPGHRRHNADRQPQDRHLPGRARMGTAVRTARQPF